MEPVRHRPRRRRRAVADDERRRPGADVLGPVVAHGRRGADHDEVLRPGTARTAARRRRRSSPPSRSTRRATCSSTPASRTRSSPIRAAIGDHVARSRARLSPAFSMVFDEALVQAHQRLVANPADPRAKVAFVTHLPPGDRGDARADRVRVHHPLPRASGPAARASSRATRRSTTTSSATSATASGTCARPSPTTRRSASRSARRCASCCPPSPPRSRRPTRRRHRLGSPRRQRRGDPGLRAHRARTAGSRSSQSTSARHEQRAPDHRARAARDAHLTRGGRGEPKSSQWLSRGSPAGRELGRRSDFQL